MSGVRIGASRLRGSCCRCPANHRGNFCLQSNQKTGRQYKQIRRGALDKGTCGRGLELFSKIYRACALYSPDATTNGEHLAWFAILKLRFHIKPGVHFECGTAVTAGVPTSTSIDANTLPKDVFLLLLLIVFVMKMLKKQAFKTIYKKISLPSTTIVPTIHPIVESAYKFLRGLVKSPRSDKK